MDLFTVIEGSAVVLRSKGVFKQVPAYRRGNRIYAKWGNGFIRLGGNQLTSAPNVQWETMELPFPVRLGPLKEPLMPAGPEGLVAQGVSA